MFLSSTYQGEAIYSVGRQTLNDLLLRIVSDDPKIKIHFNCLLLSAEKNGSCVFKDSSSTFEIKYDLVVGADGAYSATRECLLKQGRISFSRQYIAHGYKELSIPPVSSTTADGRVVDTFALYNPNGLHIWPRKEFMLIALPNPDFSFTATLFAPYKGADGFDSIESGNDEEVKTYFKKHFPDVIPLMPELGYRYL